MRVTVTFTCYPWKKNTECKQIFIKQREILSQVSSQCSREVAEMTGTTCKGQRAGWAAITKALYSFCGRYWL